MPANLTPEYKKAEQAYKEAKDPHEKLLCLERMLSTIPKHKGTDHMQADIKRRMAKTKQALEKKGGPKKGFGINIPREGAARIVLIGAPNSGKSALVEATTNARVEVGDHPFATREPVPAMFPFENVQFQLVDLPPASREHMEYWVTDVVRAADSALWVIDAADAAFETKIAEVREALGARKVELVGPEGEESEMHAVVRRLRSLTVATKMDEAASAEVLPKLRESLEPEFPVLALSAIADSDFTALGRALFDLNRIVRVYSKTSGKKPDRSAPFILHRGDTLLDFSRQVHKDFSEQLKFAKVWGEGKFDGQRVPRDRELVDGDVVELHL
ncbi:MAG: GTPase [Planctomycetota bacterium]|jgi:ribosome-interacting GTPase 1